MSRSFDTTIISIRLSTLHVQHSCCFLVTVSVHQVLIPGESRHEGAHEDAQTCHVGQDLPRISSRYPSACSWGAGNDVVATTFSTLVFATGVGSHEESLFSIGYILFIL